MPSKPACCRARLCAGADRQQLTHRAATARKRVSTFSLWLIFTTVAFAQDQKGGIRGTVTDSATHQPVRRATVTLQFNGMMSRDTGPLSATSDAGGAFALDSVPAGEYFLMVQHRDYPQARAARKKIEVKPGEITSGVTFELTPGGAISGHVSDEDSDPLNGCNVQVHQASQPRHQVGFAQIDENGEYRVSCLTPGKYLVSANCFTLPFQPRPFSPGPDPPPSLAYMMQYYAGRTIRRRPRPSTSRLGLRNPASIFGCGQAR